MHHLQKLLSEEAETLAGGRAGREALAEAITEKAHEPISVRTLENLIQGKTEPSVLTLRLFRAYFGKRLRLELAIQPMRIDDSGRPTARPRRGRPPGPSGGR